MRPDALFAIEDWMRRNNIAQNLPEHQREQLARKLLERLEHEVKHNWDDYTDAEWPSDDILGRLLVKERERYRRELIHSITDQLEQLDGDGP